MNREDEWMTVREAAEWSGYHAEHIRILIRRGDIYAKKWGPVWQVSRESVKAYRDAAKSKASKKYGPRGA